MIYRLLGPILTVVVVLVSTVTSAQTIITKGTIDDRQYDYFTLENGLQVLLISDPTTDKAAAALDVGVGSADNPRNREGLAHFLEHMLFLGTEKYPEAGAYQRFISEHGGAHNAYTSLEHTNYFFDVSHDYLYQTLDQFAQFFITPSLDDAYIKRETNAVHSEYQAKIKDDYRRGYDVYRQLLNPAHPYSTFSVGSLETLADRADQPIKKDLVAFYKQHYVADNMRLVVLGRDSLASLKENVKKMFSAVPKGASNDDKKLSTPATKRPSLFLAKALPKTVYIKPVRDSRSFTLVFPLPPVENYNEKSLSYISNILGYEGKGSLLSLLKSKGWAEGLSAGGDDQADDHSTFTISVRLTELGYQNIDSIRSLIFSAIEAIEDKGINQWRFLEIKNLANLDFEFREKNNPINAVSSLANNLHYYAAKDVIRGDYAFDHFNAKAIKQFVQALEPGNALTMVTAPEVSTDSITDKYQVPYRVAATVPVADDIITLNNELKKRYQLPLKNEFVPVSTTIAKPAEKTYEVPQLSKQSSKQDFWYLQDARFNVPKAFVASRLKSPLIGQSARNAAMANLWVALVKDSLNETLYDASLAGINASISATNRGIDLEVTGYNDKLPLLLDSMKQALASPSFSQARFADLKRELMRGWRNSAKQTPYKRLFSALPATLFSPYWSDDALKGELESVTLKDLEAFAASWHKGGEQEALVYGNVTKTQADEIFSTMESMLSDGQQTVQKAKVAKLQLSEPATQSVDVSHSDSAVMLYLQAIDDTIEDNAKMALIRQVLDAPYYNDLRTEQQLGYIVFVTSYALKDVAGTAFMVQSPTADVDYLKKAVSTFVKQFTLPEDLQSHRQAVMAKLTEKPKRLSEQAGHYWRSVLREDNDFEYRQRLAKTVGQLKEAEVKSYFDDVFQKPTRKLWLSSRKLDKKNEASSKAATKPVAASSYYQYP